MDDLAAAAAPAAGIPAFDNSYARLPQAFHVRQAPVPVRAPGLIRLNGPLAHALGFDPDAIAPEDWAAMLSGNRPVPGAEPLAMAYAGHQFGNFVPQLGDGRAILLGEVHDREGHRRDIQIKGAGRTPFSRGGDGRAALGPVLREYIVSEAMHALAIPTTRALAAVATGEWVFRETRLPGAVLTRVASGHVRVGTFQYFAARGDHAALARLTDYVIARHYPHAAEAETPALALLGAVAAGQAALIARWMGVGFIHGVMNTDNMSLAGETIDYGPCAFMDAYDPATVFSSIDHGGRYAYGNQPRIAQWNLCRLAETLLGLIDDDAERAVARATEEIEAFGPRFEAEWLDVMRAKLGLTAEHGTKEDDRALVTRLLGLMEAAGADFTLTFRALSAGAQTLATRIGTGEAAAAWRADWQARLAAEGLSQADAAARLDAANPGLIPRNHIVERALEAAVQEDFAPFHRLVDLLADPFAPGAETLPEAAPPRPEERIHATFCGT